MTNHHCWSDDICCTVLAVGSSQPRIFSEREAIDCVVRAVTAGLCYLTDDRSASHRIYDGRFSPPVVTAVFLTDRGKQLFRELQQTEV